MTDVAVPQGLTGYRPSDAGVLTHALIATLLPDLARLEGHRLAEALMTTAGRLVTGTNVNRRRVLVSTAVSNAARYLRRAALGEPFRLLGCEWTTGSGRVDIAWVHQDGRVVFDEIKTSINPVSGIPPQWREQAQTYLISGRAEHGDNFVGVRLIPCDSLFRATMLLSDGAWVALPDPASVPGVDQ